MIGASGFMQAPKETKKSIAFDAGQAAKLRGESLKKSALRSLLPGSKQYDDFIDGFNSLKKNGKPASGKF